MEEVHRSEERHRLANELHDSVSQALFSMTLHTRAIELAVSEQGVDPTGRVRRGLADLRELTQDAQTEMRALIFQLRPESLHEEGLAAALRRYAAGVSAREQLAVYVYAGEDRLPLDEQAEAELFRVVQEAVYNSVKHANPGRIDIRPHEVSDPDDASGTLVVEVTDDGVGFDPAVIVPGHLGLRTMRERTERVGGRLTIDSAPGRPTTVRAVLPNALRGGRGAEDDG